MFSPVILADEVLHPAGHLIPHHTHPEGQLLLILGGTATVTADSGFWLAPPGFGVWLPPHAGHGARFSEASVLINVRINAALTRSFPEQCTLLFISDLLRELALEATRIARQANQNEADQAAMEMMARLIGHQTARAWQGGGLFVPHGNDRRLRQAIDLLRSDPGFDISLEELARYANTSVRTLARLFVAETGMPFRRWRECLRVVSAIDLLARGQSITQTALALGYQSASSFTTLFTRLLGHPPKRYMHLLRIERLGQ